MGNFLYLCALECIQGSGRDLAPIENILNINIIE